MMKNKGQNCKTSVTFSWLLAISALDSKDCLLLIKYVLITQLLKYILRLKHMYCLYFVRLLEAWSGAWNFVQLMLMSTSCFEKTSTLVKRCKYHYKNCQSIILIQKRFTPQLEKSLKKSSKFYCQSSVLMPLNPIKSKVLTQ